jgi:hypothetical protein
MLLPRVPCPIKNLVRLAGGQPFVPQMNRQPTQFTERRCKSLGLRRLGTHVARQMYWIPHHYSHHAKPTRQPRQRAQVFSRDPGCALPLQCQHWLRRQPQLIRHSNPDTPVADIQSEIAWLRFQIRFSRGDAIALPTAILPAHRHHTKSPTAPFPPDTIKAENLHGNSRVLTT